MSANPDPSPNTSALEISFRAAYRALDSLQIAGSPEEHIRPCSIQLEIAKLQLSRWWPAIRAVDYDLYQADLESYLQTILLSINGLSQDPKSQSLTHSQQQYVDDIWAIKELRRRSARHLGNVQDVPMPKSKFVGHDQLKRFAALMHGLEPDVMRQQLSQLRIGDTASLQGEQGEVEELRRNAMAIDAELARGLRHRSGHEYSDTHVQENGLIKQGNSVSHGYEGPLPYFNHVFRNQTAMGNGAIHQGDDYGDNTGDIRRTTSHSNNQNQP